MLQYIIRRTAYSILIILGVLVLTFVLFRVAAGDPAAALLGKSPSPKEVEDLRNELGTNRPLLFGYWRRTEAFTSGNFTEKLKLPGITLSDDCSYGDGYLVLPANASVVFARNFDLQGKEVQATILFKGKLILGDQTAESEDWDETDIPVSPGATEVKLTATTDSAVEYVSFYRRQDSPFDSQLKNSLVEIISFSSQFPYVSILNFGKSLSTHEPIRDVLYRGVWPSLMLMVPIFFGELILGIALALFATACKDSWVDRSIVVLSVAGMSISYLVFIIFGQWYIGYYFNLFPVWGWFDAGSFTISDLRFLILPVAIGVVSGLGSGVRFYRTIFINELSREYLRTARAKGCSEFTVYTKHLLRNALIPIITRAATILPFLFTGSLLLESFFGIPGLGFAGINALMNADLQMIKALVILSALLFVSINLLADIAYAWADPTIRLAR